MGTMITIPRAAQAPMAGIDYVLVCNYGDVIPTIDASGYATFAESSLAIDVSAAFTKLKVTKETSSVSSPATGTPATGAISYMHTANLVFAKNDVTNRIALNVMGLSELYLVAVARNGINYFLGDENNGLDLTAGDQTTGVAPNDLSGISLTLTGSMPKPLSIVSALELAKILPA